MAANDDEEELLRSVALQNSKTILLARQRAEEELVRAKEALELKTQALAHSLAMMRATLESTTDGILVTDGGGKVTGFNDNFVQMWRLSREIMDLGDHRQIRQVTSELFQEPRQMLARIDEIYASSPPESYDLLELADGRAIERFSRIQFVDDRNVGRVWSFRDITQRLRAEEALAKQSEWLRVTLGSIGDAVITTDTQRRVTFLNAVAESLTGWKIAEAAGQPLETVFHIVNEKTHQSVESPATRVLRDGVIVGLANHTVLIAKDGTERPIDDSAAPIKDDQGNVAGCVLIFRDVSEQRQALRALEQSEARKTAILDTALDCIITCDHDGKIIEFNPAAERTFGHRREDVIGRELSDIVVPPSLRQRHRHGMTRFMRTRQSRILGQRLEMTGLRADGREFPVEFSVTQIPTDGLPLFTAYLRDITDRKEADDQLRASEERLRFVMDSMPQKIFTAKPNGDVDYFNPQWTQFTGLSFEQIKDWGWTQFIHPDDVAENVRVWRQSIESGQDFNFEHRFRRADGEYRWHVSRAVPMRDETGSVLMWVGSNTDIHQQKQTATELRRLAADLSEADRRKNEFMAMLAHELRNPLAPIRNALQIVQLKTRRAHQQLEDAAVLAASEMMERQIAQMVRLVDDLLDVSRISRGKIELRRERIELASVVNQAVEAAQALVQCLEHELGVTLPPQSVYLMADRTRLAQVLGNLLNNACKFTNKGGRIELVVSVEWRVASEEKKEGTDDGRATLSRAQGVASSDESGRAVLPRNEDIPQGGTLRPDEPDSPSRGIDTRQHRRGTRPATHQGIPEPSEHPAGIAHGSGNAPASQPPGGLAQSIDPGPALGDVGRDRSDAHGASTRAGSEALKLATRHSPLATPFAVIRVRDNGIGIAADQLPRIFDLFVQIDTSLERSVSGLGIGLTLVKNLVEMHDGTVEVHSTGVGQGCEFVVRLPMLVEAAELPPEPTASSPTPITARRILVVDDNRDSATSLALLLKLTGNETRAAYDGLEAVEAAATFRPDVILLDIGLPKLNGYEACRHLRAQPWGKNIVLIALTGWGQEEDREKSGEAGFNAHLVKPVDLDVLNTLLAEMPALPGP